MTVYPFKAKKLATPALAPSKDAIPNTGSVTALFPSNGNDPPEYILAEAYDVPPASVSLALFANDV